MKTKALLKYKTLFLLILILASCSEVIDLKTESAGGQLVIEGRITNGTMGNLVNITRTLQEDQAPEPISGAVVKVIDGNGLEEGYVETSPGKYELCQDVVLGEVGSTYRLQVDLDGKTYTSSIQEMMPILARDELRFELDIQDAVTSTGVATSSDVVRVFANSTLDNLPEEFFIRWTMEEAYTVVAVDLPRSIFSRYSPMQCYITNELSAQDIFLVDGTAIRNVNLNNREVAVRPLDYTFRTNHYFNIIQFAQNKEAHDYWQNLKSLTTRQGSIFDAPPAQVPGNITSSDPSESVFGFFEAAAVDTARLRVTNTDIPLFFLDPCQMDREDFFKILRLPPDCFSCLIEEKIVEPECLYCNLLSNSSLTRPSYY